MASEPLLNEVEVRVLGCLLEKETTTPEYYPLTLNALTAACNQKSNRYPVVDYSEKDVVRSLEALREKQWVRMVSGAEMRVPRYYHRLADRLGLGAPELAALGVLMLRGPQTSGEIRGRAERLHGFPDLDAVESVLQGLIDRPQGALAVRLPRQAGHKESRYAHLLAGQPVIVEDEAGPRLEPASLQVRTEDERLDRLEAQVAALRREVEEVKAAFAAFRRQFE
ncbi:MAG: YceH family protein [Candidatus Latescibacterota bacterium]